MELCVVQLRFISCHHQMEEVAARQEDGAPGKKRRKKKKKAKGGVEDVEAESEEPAFNQKPPKFEVIK